jgi:predicted Zn-dependent peptidase
VVDRNVPQSAVYMAWHMASRTEDNFYRTDLISDVLSNGNSSRMYQDLVKKSKMFSDISAFVTGDMDRGLFIVTGKLLNGATLQEADNLIFSELSTICQQAVSKEELRKINNKIEANLLFGRMSVLNKAMSLGYYEMLGNAHMLDEEVARYRAVTLEDIQNTAKEIFIESKPSKLFYKAKSN